VSQSAVRVEKVGTKCHEECEGVALWRGEEKARAKEKEREKEKEKGREKGKGRGRGREGGKVEFYNVAINFPYVIS
jgi:hypothetical protein